MSFLYIPGDFLAGISSNSSKLVVKSGDFFVERYLSFGCRSTIVQIMGLRMVYVLSKYSRVPEENIFCMKN